MKYESQHRDLRIYEMGTIPNTKQPLYFGDPQNRAYIGSLCYHIHVLSSYIIEYRKYPEEVFMIEVRGELVEKRNALTYGTSIFIQDEKGVYVCLYRNSSESQIYVAGNQIKLYLRGTLLVERTIGDQLGQIYIPKSCIITTISDQHQIID